MGGFGARIKANLAAKMTFKNVLIGAVAVFVLLILAIFLLAYLPARHDPEGASYGFLMLRELLVVVLTLQTVLIVFGVAVVIWQVANLVWILQKDGKPVLETLLETLKTAKGSVQFVGTNLATPIIKAGGFMAGASVFVRELGGIRRAIRRSPAADQSPTENG